MILHISFIIALIILILDLITNFDFVSIVEFFFIYRNNINVKIKFLNFLNLFIFVLFQCGMLLFHFNRLLFYYSFKFFNLILFSCLDFLYFDEIRAKNLELDFSWIRVFFYHNFYLLFLFVKSFDLDIVICCNNIIIMFNFLLISLTDICFFFIFFSSWFFA